MSKGTLSKMNWWKWSVPMLLEIDTVQAFMTLNRPWKEREKNRKSDMPEIELRPRFNINIYFNGRQRDLVSS